MKKKLRSLLALALALAVMLSLAACGSKKDEEKAEEHPDMVYTSESVRLDSAKFPNGISPMLYTEEGFYGQSYEEAQPRPLTETADRGEDAAEEESQTPDEAEDAEQTDGDTVEPTQEVNDTYTCHLYFVAYDGTVEELSAYKALPAEPDPGDKTDFYSGSSLNALILDPNGELVAVESVYCGWFDGTKEEQMVDSPATWEKYRNSQEYYLRRLNEDGSEKDCIKLDYHDEDAYLYFGSSQFDDKGNLIVVSDQAVFGFAPDGSVCLQISLDNYSERLLKLRDGSLAVFGYSDTGIALFPLDLEKKTVGEAISIPQDAYNLRTGDANYDFYYVNGMYLYGYRLDTEENVKLLNFLDVDVRGNSLDSFYIRSDSSLMCVSTQYRSERTDTDVIRIFQVPYDSVPQKETLTLAVMYGDAVFDKVVDFNRRSDKVRIQVIDYAEFNDPENDDYEAGIKKLLTEIMSGQVPDLIAMGQLPYSQLAAKGILEDLYPYIDADPQMKREDFFENVLSALEVDGGLYQIAPGFNVQTLMGATKVVGDTPGWTYKDLQAALATMPDGCEPMDMYTTRGDLLRTLLCADLDHYVDWAKGECHFETEDFAELLAFTAQFPESIPDDMEWESSSTRLAEGRQMLTTAYLSSIDSQVWNDAEFGDLGCTYIGYPTNNGVGSYMFLSQGYSMSAACKNKDAGWSFLRTFLEEDAQQDEYDGLPISKKVYRERLEKAMTPEYEKDENGEFILDENGEKKQVPIGGYWTEDGTEKKVYCMTQAQADKMWEAVSTCNKIWQEDSAIYTIVFEQAQAYYAGQKTIEEVARLIQNKVTIYINEQR